MEITVVKKLNGIEIHPASTSPMGEAIPMSVIGTYTFEVSELGYLDRRHINLAPYLTQTQITWLEQRIAQAQQIIDQL